MAPITAAVAAASLALVACGASTEASDGEDGAGSGFVHEDARGKTIEVDGTPETVVAQASAAAALWDNGFKVDGVYGDLPEPPNYLTGNLDVSETKVLGKAWGEFNVEEYAAMNPDLLIDMTFDGKTLWYAGEVEKQVDKLAPTLAMPLTGLSVTEQIEAFQTLAEDLGADPETDEAKAEFEDAVARIEAVVEKNPDLTVVAASTYGEEIYFANAPEHPDLAYLAELGVKFPKVTPDEQGIFEPVSLENISKYHADVLLVDARDPGGLEELRTKDIFKRLPAVAAGQQDLWYPAAPYSYQAYAEVFRGYADQLEAAQVLEQG
ncbi:ABC transporter substrate-binding protein [Nocardioides sp. KC13]|uniref:ABC transporter substrate-binding protein n=1 Tax=Nocardioides turkmenicus TaxID=2711220 RepID=A0A6M1QXW3_9ACTN|nr:ABC transporter substrate-binding protein [Nocardioides sp. KC13]NGN94845.1 ABC transporter substrate-binding protein [Nocardioides sp. KC13]